MRNRLNKSNLKKLGAMGLLIALPALNACKDKKEDPTPAQHDTIYKFITSDIYLDSTNPTADLIKSSADSASVKNVILSPNDTNPIAFTLAKQWNKTLTGLQSRFAVSNKVKGNGTFTIAKGSNGIIAQSDSLSFIQLGYTFQNQK